MKTIPQTVESKLLGTSGEIVHFFTTRVGGVSCGVASSLNMGFTDNDNNEKVLENRKLALENAGMPHERLINLKQIHSSTIVAITSNNSLISGGTIPKVAGEGDALITDIPGVPVMVLTADCVPVLLFDKHRKVIAAVHAGWRGTVAKIVSKTVERMTNQYGSNPSDIIAAIGPSIGACCYEVGVEVKDEAAARGIDVGQTFSTVDNRLFFDLWKANELQLVDSVVNKSSIDRLDICSKCNSHQFFSSRADAGNTGRTGSVIMLK